MMLADISPIFKKDDSLCKENYRSVNLLTIVSKLFENIMSDQLTDYFRNYFVRRCLLTGKGTILSKSFCVWENTGAKH